MHSTAPPVVAVTVIRPMTWRYVACWMGLMLLHVANVVFYVGFAALYTGLCYSNLGFQLMTYSIGIPMSEYGAIATTHAIVAGIHVFFILLMTGSSISAKRLVFFPQVSLQSSLSKSLRWIRQCSCHRRAAVETRGKPSISEKIVQAAILRVSSVFGREGLLGVDGVYFDDMLVMRELLETSLQSYQAYRMTQLLPRLGLIRVYVALLVANSWIVPGLHRIYKHQRNKRRLLNLLCDALLDMLSSMGVTVLIFATYAPQYTDQTFGFPFANWFIDEWFTSVYQEFQIMLVESWSDMAARLVFAAGLLQCMNSLKRILTPSTTTRPSHDAMLALAPTLQCIKDCNKVLPGEATLSSRPRGRLKEYVLHTLAPRCFMIWGFAILGVHLYAESNATDWPCKLRLRPWLVAKPACSLVEIDCHALDTAGFNTLPEVTWTRFEPTLTAHVTIRHCASLTIPNSIDQFHRLTSFKVYNSTIVSWPTTAAITSQSHQSLRGLYFIRTTFPNASLPPGLTTSDFPKTFRSFIASATNLESLPGDLAWPQRMSIALERSPFTSVPEVLMRLLPSLISLSDSPLVSLPVALFEIPTLQTLVLCNTKIQELPRRVESPSREMYLLLLSGTNISTIWSWADPIINYSLMGKKQFFNVYNTPFCTERQQIEVGTRSRFSAADTIPMSALAAPMDVSTPERLAFSKEAVGCDVEYGAFFPLGLEDAISAIKF